MAERVPSPEDASKNPDAAASRGSFGSWWGRRSGWIHAPGREGSRENVVEGATSDGRRTQNKFGSWFVKRVENDLEGSHAKEKERERRRRAREELKKQKVVDIQRYRELKRTAEGKAPENIGKLVGWCLLGLLPVWIGGRELAKWLVGSDGVKTFNKYYNMVKKPYENWQKERWKLSKKKSTADVMRDYASAEGLQVRTEAEAAAEEEPPPAAPEPQQPAQAA